MKQDPQLFNSSDLEWDNVTHKLSESRINKHPAEFFSKLSVGVRAETPLPFRGVRVF